MKKIKRIRVLMLLALLGMAMQVSAQIPAKPNPPRLVNDFAKIFTAQQTAALEDSLVQFSKKTSNQVVIVTVNDLGGMAPSQFAYEIGEKWGVGGEKLDNGVVILIKPKTDTKGEVFIATGYGVEGALPDASCSVIINREMIPSFKENNYYGGVNKAIAVILPVLANEYSIEEYEKGEEDKMIVGLAMLIAGMALVFIVIALVSKDQDNKNDRNGNSGTFGGGNGGDVAAAILLGSLLGGRSSGRSGGSFGGGSFGGGGFGGFGGGSFGGGGAGGSW